MRALTGTRPCCGRGPSALAECARSPERVLVRRACARFVDRDHVALHELEHALVERLHAELLSGLDRRIHLRDLVFAYEVTNGGRAEHDLVRGHPSLPVLRLDERL